MIILQKILQMRYALKQSDFVFAETKQVNVHILIIRRLYGTGVGRRSAKIMKMYRGHRTKDAEHLTQNFTKSYRLIQKYIGTGKLPLPYGFPGLYNGDTNAVKT